MKMKNFEFNGKLHGINILYYNGNIRYKCYYKNGKRDGGYIRYYSNCNIFEKCYYKNGKLEGEYFSYHENGNIQEKMLFFIIKMQIRRKNIFHIMKNVIFIQCYFKN
jgi:antitoxin component YwqK of YwqJK toxin-antitoxin module